MGIAFTVVITMLKKRFSGIDIRFYVQFCYLRVEKQISDETVDIHTLDNTVLCRICRWREQRGMSSRAGQPTWPKLHS